MIHTETLELGSFGTNCYLVWGEDSPTCVVIDPGYEPQRVELKARHLGKQIQAILLTHGHFDHVGGVRQLAEATGCKVYLCPEDLNMPGELTAGPLYYTDTYAEGDRLELAGLTLRVLHTPGHTPGSVCLLAEDRIFSGDTLFCGSCGRTDLPGGSWPRIRDSLLRLGTLKESLRVFPGHGQDTTLEQEKKTNPYMH